MKAIALLHVSRTVSDLVRSETFHRDALGFSRVSKAKADRGLAALLGAGEVTTVLMARGCQFLELAVCDPPGAPYPSDSASNELHFQHCALVTDDMAASYTRLCRHAFSPISLDGPQSLPGGLIAFKFRDPDGHPLELIQFPTTPNKTSGGIDHSAIAVSDADASIAFYTDVLGLAVLSRQVNGGPAQDALDGLLGAIVDVVGLAPIQPAPHLELLAYRSPPGRSRPRPLAADIGADRLVFHVDELPVHPAEVFLVHGKRSKLLHDPDGHSLQLMQRRAEA